MNYRHAYHAGNFADVLKHSVLALILDYMTRKPQPLRVIDVHAGIGLYSLDSEEAQKTGEWRDGIGRLIDVPLPADAADLLKPYLEAVRSLNDGGPLRSYPGSPALARKLMRRTDTLVANELHPEDFQLLRSALNNAPNTKVLNLDAWVALKSLLPPPERRGLILIDPPFEAPGEFANLASGAAQAIRRFASGTYVIWYPIKDPREVSRFLVDVRALGLPKLLHASLAVCARGAKLGLTETGILIVNPPFVLKDQLTRLLPVLASALAVGPGAGSSLEDWSS